MFMTFKSVVLKQRSYRYWKNMFISSVIMFFAFICYGIGVPYLLIGNKLQELSMRIGKR